MKRLIFCGCLIILLALQHVNAQLTTGLTGKPDTSYTISSAFAGTIKNYPGIKIVPEYSSNNIETKKNIVYCKAGERELLLDVFYPAKKSKQPTPVFMMIHGGGWRSGNRTQHYPLVQRLAERGYFCITPEYRLSTEALFPAAIYDLKAAVRWIYANAKRYNLDKTKIAVGGFSAGGELAAFLGTTIHNNAWEGSGCNDSESKKIHAIVDIDGTLSFVHPESGEGDDTKRISAATHWFGYAKKDNPALWEKASPLTYADSTTPPFLFINSSVARMHAGRNDFISILGKHHIYSEVHEIKDSPHSFCLFHPWFDQTLQYIDDYLRKVFSR